MTTRTRASRSALAIGDRVRTSGKEGVVRFLGTTQFASGEWVGIELDEPLGKSNGTVSDVEYFKCADLHGLFVKKIAARKVASAADSADTGAPPPATRRSSRRKSGDDGAAGAGAGSGSRADGGEEGDEGASTSGRRSRTRTTSSASATAARASRAPRSSSRGSRRSVSSAGDSDSDAAAAGADAPKRATRATRASSRTSIPRPRASSRASDSGAEGDGAGTAAAPATVTRTTRRRSRTDTAATATGATKAPEREPQSGAPEPTPEGSPRSSGSVATSTDTGAAAVSLAAAAATPATPAPAPTSAASDGQAPTPPAPTSGQSKLDALRERKRRLTAARARSASPAPAAAAAAAAGGAASSPSAAGSPLAVAAASTPTTTTTPAATTPAPAAAPVATTPAAGAAAGASTEAPEASPSSSTGHSPAESPDGDSPHREHRHSHHHRHSAEKDAKIKQMMDQHASMQTALRASATRIRELKTKVHEKTAEVAAAHKEVEALKAKLAEGSGGGDDGDGDGDGGSGDADGDADGDAEGDERAVQLQTELDAARELLRESAGRISSLEASVAAAEAKAKAASAEAAQSARTRLEAAASKAADSKASRRIAALEEQVAELEHSIELLKLDKEELNVEREMAVDESTHATELLERTRSELATVTAELADAKEAADKAAARGKGSRGGGKRGSSGGGGDDDEDSSERVAALESQNQRLRAGLQKLRQMTDAERADLRRRLRHNERAAAQLPSALAQARESGARAAKLQASLDAARERLDDAAAFESMVETLTERNLALGDANGELTAAVSELEQVRLLSDQVEAEQAAYEDALRAELDTKNAALGVALRRERELRAQLAERDHAIARFRELGRRLAADRVALQEQLAVSAGAGAARRQHMRAVVEYNRRLQARVRKARAAALRTGMAEVYSRQWWLRVRQTLAFAPTDLFGTNGSTLRCLRVLDRLARTEAMLRSLLAKQHLPAMGDGGEADEDDEAGAARALALDSDGDGDGDGDGGDSEAPQGGDDADAGEVDGITSVAECEQAVAHLRCAALLLRFGWFARLLRGYLYSGAMDADVFTDAGARCSAAFAFAESCLVTLLELFQADGQLPRVLVVQLVRMAPGGVAGESAYVAPIDPSKAGKVASVSASERRVRGLDDVDVPAVPTSGANGNVNGGVGFGGASAPSASPTSTVASPTASDDAADSDMGNDAHEPSTQAPASTPSRRLSPTRAGRSPDTALEALADATEHLKELASEFAAAVTGAAPHTPRVPPHLRASPALQLRTAAQAMQLHFAELRAQVRRARALVTESEAQEAAEATARGAADSRATAGGNPEGVGEAAATGDDGDGTSAAAQTAAAATITKSAADPQARAAALQRTALREALDRVLAEQMLIEGACTRVWSRVREATPASPPRFALTDGEASLPTATAAVGGGAGDVVNASTFDSDDEEAAPSVVDVMGGDQMRVLSSRGGALVAATHDIARVAGRAAVLLGEEGALAAVLDGDGDGDGDDGEHTGDGDGDGDGDGKGDDDAGAGAEAASADATADADDKAAAAKSGGTDPLGVLVRALLGGPAPGKGKPKRSREGPSLLSGLLAFRRSLQPVLRGDAAGLCDETGGESRAVLPVWRQHANETREEVAAAAKVRAEMEALQSSYAHARQRLRQKQSDLDEAMSRCDVLTRRAADSSTLAASLSKSEALLEAERAKHAAELAQYESAMLKLKAEQRAHASGNGGAAGGGGGDGKDAATHGAGAEVTGDVDAGVGKKDAGGGDGRPPKARGGRRGSHSSVGSASSSTGTGGPGMVSQEALRPLMEALKDTRRQMNAWRARALRGQISDLGELPAVVTSGGRVVSSAASQGVVRAAEAGSAINFVADEAASAPGGSAAGSGAAAGAGAGAASASAARASAIEAVAWRWGGIRAPRVDARPFAATGGDSGARAVDMARHTQAVAAATQGILAQLAQVRVVDLKQYDPSPSQQLMGLEVTKGRLQRELRHAAATVRGVRLQQAEAVLGPGGATAANAFGDRVYPARHAVRDAAAAPPSGDVIARVTMHGAARGSGRGGNGGPGGGTTVVPVEVDHQGLARLHAVFAR